MKTMHWRKYSAELLSTGTLTFAVLVSLAFTLPLSTPVVAGLVVGLFVYTIGGISGAHINPAVTAGMWSVGKIGTDEAVKYIVAQLAGAVLAMKFFVSFVGTFPILPATQAAPAGVMEAIGAFLLVYGVSSVAYRKTDVSASGLVVGVSLLLGILVASVASNGILNPAVALGLSSATFAYIVGPLVGGIAGARCYQWMASK